METKKYEIPRRTPVGFRRVRKDGRVTLEIDPAKADALRLAAALRATGKLSVREIARVVAGHGITDGNGKPLAPATMWRVLKKLDS